MRYFEHEGTPTGKGRDMGPRDLNPAHLPAAAGPGLAPGRLPGPRGTGPLAKYGVKEADARRADDSPTEVPS